jgi:hypothetical protein
MTNHCHFVVETPQANLSKGMRQLNGVYTQYVNRRHELVGHLFQGRFKAILVERDAYLVELSRYPERALGWSSPSSVSWKRAVCAATCRESRLTKAARSPSGVAASPCESPR